MRRIHNIIISPYFLALPISLAIIFLLPPIFEKYTIKLFTSIYSKGQQHYYHDLDHDNYTEAIRTGKGYGSSAFPCITCYRDFLPGVCGEQIDQFNTNKPFIINSRLMFGDYDNDHKDEVYFFSYSNDSIFLQGLDPLSQRRFFLEKFITTVTFREEQPDFEIYNGGLHDIDNNGYKEVIFTINAGFSVYPRAIYIYDIYNDSLNKSNNQNACFVGSPKIINYDNSTYILPDCYAPGNSKDTSNILYSDYSSWLFLFNNKLEPIFTPKKNNGYRSGIYSEPVILDNQLFIAAAYSSPYDDSLSCLILYDLTGKELVRNKWDNISSLKVLPQYFTNKNSIPVFHYGEGEIYYLDAQLQIKDIKKTEATESEMFPLDIDRDGRLEFLYKPAAKKELIIFRNDLKDPAKINYPHYESAIIPSVRSSEKHEANLAVQYKDRCYFYIYKKNPYWPLKFLFYFATYLFIALFFNLLFKLQRKSTLKKYEQERKIMELELMTIKNQMDPHFTFNAINSISSVMYNEDRKKAYAYMVDFANLIRSSLVNSKNISVPLNDEIEFVKNYLKLQKLRHNYKFEFNINKDEDISDDIIIPKMIIQTFAENAVKHGLAEKDSGGLLEINIININKYLQISIIDNGIGREKAKELNKKSTGIGMEIIDQTLELYWKLQKIKVTYQVKDLYANGRASGTVVTVKIPFDKN